MPGRLPVGLGAGRLRASDKRTVGRVLCAQFDHSFHGARGELVLSSDRGLPVYHDPGGGLPAIGSGRAFPVRAGQGRSVGLRLCPGRLDRGEQSD